MICDIEISAIYELAVSSTIERIFENEIYPANHIFLWKKPVKLTWRNANVRSMADARQLVAANLDVATTAVEARLHAEAHGDHFYVERAEPVDVEGWTLTLRNSSADGRRSWSIEVVQVPVIRG